MSETYTPEFEPDQDFLATVRPEAPFGYQIDELGLLNAQPADVFPESISQDVEGLLFLGYLTEDFTLFGHNFQIRTLRSGEKLAVAKVVKEWEDTLAVGDAISIATVAGCVTLVDSRPLSIPLGSDEEKRPEVWIRRNFDLVARWYDPIINGIWDQYQSLLIRQTRAFLELQGKY